jgi:hypothetical protein
MGEGGSRSWVLASRPFDTAHSGDFVLDRMMLELGLTINSIFKLVIKKWSQIYLMLLKQLRPIKYTVLVVVRYSTLDQYHLFSPNELVIFDMPLSSSCKGNLFLHTLIHLVCFRLCIEFCLCSHSRPVSSFEPIQCPIRSS